jgi:DNA-binding transcriptional ArsR family regulator
LQVEVLAVSEEERLENGGWAIGQSIALELDLALMAASEYFIGANLSEEVMAFFQSVSPSWQEEYRALVGESRNLLTVLESAAHLAGTLFESDYSRATLPIRELSLEDALKQAKRDSAKLGIEANASLPLAEQFVDLELRYKIATYQKLGFVTTQENPQMNVLRRTYERVARILRGGDLHTRYWHLLDRFYYEYYNPWRTAHSQVLDETEQHALMVLGTQEKAGEPPDITWLPPQNPIHIHPELGQAVQEGHLGVFFWVEPFGLADTLILFPNFLMLSFAEPGLMYQNFMTFVGEVAERTKALADPTRLTILRLIRHFGLVNTEIANYLGIARPTVSIHAKILREAGMIRSHPEGRVMRHEINPQEIRRLFRDLEQVLDLPEEDG